MRRANYARLLSANVGRGETRGRRRLADTARAGGFNELRRSQHLRAASAFAKAAFWRLRGCKAAPRAGDKWRMGISDRRTLRVRAIGVAVCSRCDVTRLSHAVAENSWRWRFSFFVEA